MESWFMELIWESWEVEIGQGQKGLWDTSGGSKGGRDSVVSVVLE